MVVDELVPEGGSCLGPEFCHKSEWYEAPVRFQAKAAKR